MNQPILAKRFASTILVFAVLTASAPATMLSCDPETSGKSIRFATAAQGVIGDGQTVSGFETTLGWTVQLDSAYAVLGPFYFYSGEPMARRQTILPSWGVAMACPTDAQFDYGAILGEVLEQYAIDLLAVKPTTTGEVQGEAGTCRSAELHIHPPGDQHLEARGGAEAFAKLEGESIALAGTAVRAEETVPFRALITIPDEGTMRIVRNIAGNVELDDISERPGKIVLQVRLDAWLDRVDFSTLTETGDDGVYVFTDGAQAKTALLQAVRNRYSYRVVWSK